MNRKVKMRIGSHRIGICALGLVAAFCMAGFAFSSEGPIADAAQRGALDQVRALLQEGLDVNGAQGDGMTALHWAAENGDLQMAEVLLEAGAWVNAATGGTSGVGLFTPLHVAAEVGDGAMVRLLLEAGADVSAGTAVGGQTPLHYAARAGNSEAIEALLAHGAEVNARETSWGQTPLMVAAAWNRWDAVEALSAGGADLSLTTKVLDLPRRARQDRVAGAVRDSVLDAFRAQTQDQTLWFPRPAEVQAAVKAARPHEDLGSDGFERIDWEEAQLGGRRLSYAELVGYQGGLTALLHAVREGNVEATMTLLDAGAEINQVSAGDLTSPLLIAMINGHFDLGLQLLERGADPNIASDAGATPLYAVINTYWAPKARHPQRQHYQSQQATYLETMEALLEAGADPNARLKKHLWYMEYTFARLAVDTWGATPFLRAAHGLDVNAMRLLLRHGADPHIRTRVPPGEVAYADDPSGLPPVEVGGPGVHPIHVATGFGGEYRADNSHRHVPDGWLPAVRFLVEELGMDVNLRDHRGMNTLHMAASRGNNELIDYLVERGADPLILNRSGMSTADLANGPRVAVPPFPRTVALLESYGAQTTRPCASC